MDEWSLFQNKHQSKKNIYIYAYICTKAYLHIRWLLRNMCFQYAFSHIVTIVFSKRNEYAIRVCHSGLTC